MLNSLPKAAPTAEPETEAPEMPIRWPGRRKTAERDLAELHKRICGELAAEGYECEMGTGAACSIVVTAPSDKFPSLRIIRDRTGRYISGIAAGWSETGFHIRAEDLPILRSTDRDAVIAHVARYVEVTQLLQERERAAKEPAVEAPPPPPQWSDWVSAHASVIAVAAVLVVALGGILGIVLI